MSSSGDHRRDIKQGHAWQERGAPGRREAGIGEGGSAAQAAQADMRLQKRASFCVHPPLPATLSAPNFAMIAPGVLTCLSLLT